MNGSGGTWFAGWLVGLGRIAILCREIVRSIFVQKIAWRDVLHQVHFTGVQSQTVVLITGAFTGMVLCAQTFFQFHKIKMDSATLAVVSVSMGSELGPVLTGLMVAGRVGAAIAAELGTMRVTEQVDALRTLNAHPVDYLVVPRVLGIIIALPVLTAEAIALGIGSAYILGVGFLGIDPAYGWHNMVQFTDSSHMLTGLVKAVAFGGIIAIVSCYKGLHCGQGAEGVGRATTQAVVTSSVAILISNFFLTMSLNQLF